MVMASEAIDLADLESWQEAFKYPLDTTRHIEQRLRTEIASNRDRLRTLVGYILLTQRSPVLTLISRPKGKLPRSLEYRRKDHPSPWIRARSGCLNVNVESRLQRRCYRQEDSRSCKVEAGRNG